MNLFHTYRSWMGWEKGRKIIGRGNSIFFSFFPMSYRGVDKHRWVGHSKKKDISTIGLSLTCKTSSSRGSVAELACCLEFSSPSIDPSLFSGEPLSVKHVSSSGLDTHRVTSEVLMSYRRLILVGSAQKRIRTSETPPRPNRTAHTLVCPRL